MAKQALFYERPTPLSPQRHSDWYVERKQDFEFAKSANSVPLMTVEIPRAASEYVIVFGGTDDIVPVVLLGVEDNQNLYITDEGGWDASYVPAFVRRYPFVFAQDKEGIKFTLCIDESWTGCNQEGRGDRLYTETGERTPRIEEAMGFLKDFQRQSERTKAYCQKLKELDLLDPVQTQVTLPSGGKRTLAGFQAVNRDKLKALPAETLAELAQSNELELIYAHLQSMNNLSLLLKRVAGPRATSAPVDELE